MTSATLSIGKTASFDFYKSRIGLTQSGPVCDWEAHSIIAGEEGWSLILLDGRCRPPIAISTT